MTQRIVRQPTSLQDLDQAADYLQRQGGPELALRFLRQAEAPFRRLAALPGMGPRYEPDDPLFDGVRYSSVSRFKKYLVFYRPIEGGIEILRVLHGARDIPGLLAEGFGPPGDEEDDAPAGEPDST